MTPMWADDAFAGIAPALQAASFVAAVRNASPGIPVEPSANAPFRSGRWLFSLNGYVDGFRGRLSLELRALLRADRAAEVLGASDGEVLFAWVLSLLDDGAGPAEALATVVDGVLARTDGKLNLLLADGVDVWATRRGNSLFTLAPAEAAGPSGRDGWLVASEPHDDDPAWTEVPEHSLVHLTATSEEPDVRPLRT
jgi:glutamine amidotransferase